MAAEAVESDRSSRAAPGRCSRPCQRPAEMLVVAHRGRRQWPLRRDEAAPIAPRGYLPASSAGVLTARRRLDRQLWNPRPASIVGSGIGVAGLLFEAAYFAGFWWTAGQTPGMRIMHLRVVDGSGSAPGLGHLRG